MAEVHLSAYLSAAAGKRFRWGSHDCMLFAADWAIARTGVDPAAAWRGTYATEAAARAIIDRFGGPLRFMRAHLHETGWRKTAHPARGDIGLVSSRTRTDLAPVAAICVREAGRYGNARWAKLKPSGLLIEALYPIEAWSHG